MDPGPVTNVAIALGSNLGDRRAHLAWAIARLQTELSDLQVSSILETTAEDVPDVQPNYLNAVAVARTVLAPAALLEMLLAMERERGRVRPSVRAARTLDLDLIFYGARTIATPALTVPHPHFRRRLFVLAPLAEVAPLWRDPVTGKTPGELLKALQEA
jgi:2-amino-4-hydroxy-6-hydroxymethyldihydropteridine diphosphokinase